MTAVLLRILGFAFLAADPDPTLDDVVPILLRRCTVCHGAREKENGLDLRTRETMLRGGKLGPAIVPGRPGESLILKRIRAGEMPPRERIVEASVKPIEPAEVEVLSRWIEAGAPETRAAPDIATAEPDPLVSDRDRSFWAFQAPRPTPVPAVRETGRVRNPIDAFLLAKLETKGLACSPEAGPEALLRRAFLDLTGMPPEPEDVQAYVADRSENAYERLIDRLLASPRYGERWAQAWLDAAGYADSDGKREQDLERPFAWRYRDYVIRSFGADKPYDRFLAEQIAGDELADHEHAPEISQELEDNLVATGFLRMAPDPTWASITNFLEDRLDVIADEIDVLGSAVLGLTIKCARCHDHKLDPIPQRDYYRLAGVLKGAFDEHDWLRSGWHPGISTGKRADRDLSQVTTAERRAWEAREAQISLEVQPLKASLEALAGKAGKEADDLRAKVAALESTRRPEPKIRALWDRGEPSPTYVLHRGDPASPGRLVGPGVPSVLTDGKTPFEVRPPWPGARSTGRRLALARWLARPENPLVARVAVNRLWRHHFGRGLVKTLGDFGKAGARPTHPELLDWLSLELIRSGWSLKAMHRLMMTSAAYRQSSAVPPPAEELDPEGELVSRMPLRRMDAEQLHDAMLLVAGRLDETRYGPPDRLEVRADGFVTPGGTAKGWRRAVYAAHERKRTPTILEAFDLPQMNPNCVERRDSIVAPQALHLLNDAGVRALAHDLATRVAAEAGSDPAARVERAFWIALSRPPSREETEAALEAMEKLELAWETRDQGAAGDANGASGGNKSTAPSTEVAAAALEGFCHAILNSAAFLYID